MSNLRDFLGGLDPDVWTDAKAGYLDANISSRAPSSTALSTATWTNTRAGNLDNLNATVSSRAPSSTALSTNVWTGTKAGYLDTNISSRVSANVWTTTYRDRIDTNISSRAPSSTALSTNVWTSTKAGYLDTSIISRVSANVWTTTYRNRIDTNISSRLSTCYAQHLNSRTSVNGPNSYSTWTISSVNTNQAWLAISSDFGGPEYSATQTACHARFVNGTNVRYGLWRSYTTNHWGWSTPMWVSYNNDTYFSAHCIRIY